MKAIRTLFYLCIAAPLVLTGCAEALDDGSSSAVTASTPTYDGVTTAVGITADNAETLALTTVEATDQAISAEATDSANPFAIAMSDQDSRINTIVTEIARQVAGSSQSMNLPAGITITADDLGGAAWGFCGGSISVPDSFYDSYISNGYLNSSITYNNFCYDDFTLGQITMNGTVTFSETATTFSIKYTNFSVSYGGTTEIINMELSCVYDNTGLWPVWDCSLSSDYRGADGKVYRIADMWVTGSGDGPYSIGATVYHPDHGSVVISGTGIWYTCSNGYPSMGTITFTGANLSSGTITFRGDCTGYDGTWNDGTTTGTFSGTW